MKVGDHIYRFDINRRVYERKPGKKYGGRIIYREHWQELSITGETSRSWLVQRFSGDRSPLKVPKKGAHRGWAFSKEEVEMDVFLNEAMPKIRDRLSWTHREDPQVLLRVAKAMGIAIPECLNELAS